MGNTGDSEKRKGKHGQSNPIFSLIPSPPLLCMATAAVTLFFTPSPLPYFTPSSLPLD
jgi:hypothetical protein